MNVKKTYKLFTFTEVDAISLQPSQSVEAGLPAGDS